MLYLIGLGLGDVDDISVKGLKFVKKCSKVYLESYTSILSYGFDKTKLEELYGKTIIEADRRMIEQNSEEVLEAARTEEVCLLIVGDPFGATTHSDLMLRAREMNVHVKVVHNASIMNAIGVCGLQLYRFGETVSIVFWEENWKPDSYYDKIAANRERGLHTLCLLDIKTKEQTVENIMKGREVFEPPRYMKCCDAARQLLEIAEKKQANGHCPAYSSDTCCVGLARIGWDSQKITFCSLAEMRSTDMGDPLHTLIIPGDLHPIELEMLKNWK